MKKNFVKALFPARSHSSAIRAPRATTLRLEALESRELLDAASLTSEIAPPPQIA